MFIAQPKDNRQTSVDNAPKKKSRRNTIIAILLGLLAIAIIAVLIGIILNLMKTQPDDDNKAYVDNTGGRGTLVVPENVERILQELNQPIEDGYYEVTMNVDWTFQTATTPSDNAYVSNSTNNNRSVYFDLVLRNNSQLIYSSPYIPVGASLTKFPLDVELAAGNYEAVCIYHLVDDDGNEITTTSIAVSIHVLR